MKKIKEPKKKYPKVPDWITMRELTAAEEGDLWFTDAGVWWKFRAIHHESGLDYVPDRGGFVETRRTDGRAAFLHAVLDSERFAKWVARQSGSSSERFCARGNEMHLIATNNKSYGYTYLWAFDKKEVTA